MTTSEIPADSLTDAELYRLVRAQIEFEAGLVAQRLSWFVASQSFLFTAYAITLNAPREPASAVFGIQQHCVYFLIPIVAMASCVLLYLAVLAGVFAQVHLRHFLVKHFPRDRLAMFPPLQGRYQTHVLGLAAPLGLPLVFVVVWIFLFTRGLS